MLTKQSNKFIKLRDPNESWYKVIEPIVHFCLNQGNRHGHKYGCVHGKKDMIYNDHVKELLQHYIKKKKSCCRLVAFIKKMVEIYKGRSNMHR